MGSNDGGAWNRKIRAKRRAAGLCPECGENPATPGTKCAECVAVERANYQARRARQPLVRRFRVALWHVERGASVRDALHRAEIEI